MERNLKSSKKIVGSRSVLRAILVQGQPDAHREFVEAYAVLSAFVQHWQHEASPEDFELLKKLLWIRYQEPDRYYKQRRLAIQLLSEEYWESFQ